MLWRPDFLLSWASLVVLGQVFPRLGSLLPTSRCPAQGMCDGQRGSAKGMGHKSCGFARTSHGHWERATVPGQSSSCLPGTVPGSGACRREDAPCPHSCFLKGTRKNGCVIRAVSWTCQGSPLIYLGTVAGFQPAVFLVQHSAPNLLFQGIALAWAPEPQPRFGWGSIELCSGSRAGAKPEGSSRCPLCSSWHSWLGLSRCVHVRCCLMGAPNLGQSSGDRDRGDIPSPPALTASLTQGCGQAAAILYVQISSMKITGLKAGYKRLLCSSPVAGLCRIIMLMETFWTCKETAQGLERDQSRVKAWLCRCLTAV